MSLAFLGMAVLPARGQDAPAKRTVVAGPSYAKGAFHRFFFGTDYRPLWTTAATFEVLDLGKEAGGLSPVRRVGGQQTKGLALKGKDGRNYTFRGLEKDASHLLDADLQGTLIAELLQDQMAAQHPASEVIARHILDAVRVPCPSWRLVVLPDDPALGDFRKDFAGAIGAFAEYPSAVSATNPGFRGVSEIVDHAELYKRLEAGQVRRGRARPAEGPARGHLHGGLGPPPQAVALGQVPGAARFGSRSPRTAIRPSRDTRGTSWDGAEAATRGSRT